MNKLIFLALIIGTVSAVAQNKVTSTLTSTLEAKENADIMISFVGSNTKVINAIETQSFKTRADRLNSLTKSLELNRDASQQSVLKFLKDRNVPFKSFWISNKISIRGASKDIIQSLATFSEVEIIDQEQVIHLDKSITPPEEVHLRSDENVWNIEIIHAPKAWAITNGTGVIVGSIDGGPSNTHESLRDNYRKDGYGWYDPYQKTDVPYASAHGTHTMGNIVGSHGIGVAPGATWMACQGCTPEEGCWESHLTECGQWILCPTRSDGSGRDCSKAPSVSSNSWGKSYSHNDPFYEAITEAWIAGGIIPVFALGNGGSGNACRSSNSPGDYRRVIGVGATTDADSLAWFSSRGPTPAYRRIKPDISAPGLQVWSAGNQHDAHYTRMSGTSMSAPHISGVIALALSVNPNLSFGEVRKVLLDGVDTNVGKIDFHCVGLPAGGIFPNYHYGFGRVDALKTVRLAQALLNKSEV